MSAYENAVARLREVLEVVRGGGNDEIGDILRARDPVLARYGPIFSSERIAELTEEDFRSFLQFKNNQHWTSITRQVTALTRQMDLLRDALTLLLDESVPIRERIDAVLGPDGMSGLGKAVVTPILLVSHPDRYGVWNAPSEGGMQLLGIWPAGQRGLSVGAKYEAINSLLLRLSRDLGIDLWTLDALWWRISPPEVSETDEAGPSAEEFENAVRVLLDPTIPLDERRSVAVRTEQEFIRRQLMKGKTTEKCVICGRPFPVELLRAAHIKRREGCSHEERLDYTNNVVPMCTFGCDEMFERGYIVVRAGRVTKGKPLGLTPPLQDYLAMVNDRPCPAYYGESRPYFEAHAESQA